MVLGSPAAVHSAGFKSPLRNFRPETCDRVSTEDVYADAHLRVMQWRKDFLSGASFEAQQGLRELRHEKEILRDLQSDLVGIQGLVQVASHLQKGGERLAEVLNSSRDAAATRTEGVVRIRDELQQFCQQQSEELQEEERKIARQREVADAQHAEALKLLSVYKDRLGLAITREAPQTVRMAFSFLDASNPDREFCFTLGLAESDQACAQMYSVKECMPEIPELPKLLQLLNDDASSITALPRFVSGMRRAFLRSAAKED
jgi:hypothetical protein